jgi:Mrr restriction endonuclease-like protein
MAIPKEKDIMLPLLGYAERGAFTNADAVSFIAAEFRLTPEEISEPRPEGSGTRLENMIYFASGTLNRAELLDNSDGVYQITDRGREVLATPPPALDRKYLMRFPEYVEARKKNTSADELEAEQADPLAEYSRNLADIRPTNLILYGPPGTGKTFSAAAEAVRLCDGSPLDGSDDPAVRRRYGELVKAGRVRFITFHQSYAYEDFVEGLRPTTGEGEKDTGGFRLETSLVCSERSRRSPNRRARRRPRADMGQVSILPADSSGR